MPYRVAADVLQHLLPIDAGMSPETLRSDTLSKGPGSTVATATENIPCGSM